MQGMAIGFSCTPAVRWPVLEAGHIEHMPFAGAGDRLSWRRVTTKLYL